MSEVKKSLKKIRILKIFNILLCIFLSISIGMLLVIIGMPETCQHQELYSLERVKQGKILLFGCIVFLIINLFQMKNSRKQLKKYEKH
jgi:uncharacterized membrane protein